MSKTLYALVALTAVLALGLTAIAIAQVATHQNIDLPPGLTGALTVGVTAVFGGTFFQGHAQVVGSMADLAQNTVPIGNVSPLGTTTTPASAATTPNDPTGSGSGARPATGNVPPGSS